MKMKKKAIIAAAAFAVAMNLSACAYGPPEWDEEDNYNMGVYGPPEFEEWEQEETDTEIVGNDDTTQTEEITSFDPAENQTVGVYGPPGEEWDYDETDTPEEEQNVGEEALNNE
ncbi:MAG: hypothetical protein HDT25_09570 [Ruminococcus sp.]|nr:hypothetical protein [Ruminococcus sp.]